MPPRCRGPSHVTPAHGLGGDGERFLLSSSLCSILMTARTISGMSTRRQRSNATRPRIKTTTTTAIKPGSSWPVAVGLALARPELISVYGYVAHSYGGVQDRIAQRPGHPPGRGWVTGNTMLYVGTTCWSSRPARLLRLLPQAK